jgi:hypothetical protein
VITDSWYGNNSLFNPLRQKLDQGVHLLSRLRANNTIFDLVDAHAQKGPGRCKKYGKKMGNAASLAAEYQLLTKEYGVNLYGRARTVLAFDRIVMLKTLKTEVRVVWVYRKTQN